MKLLVDGYNLLHASGQFGRPSDPPTLETARRTLLDYIADQLSERDRQQTTVVFDGKDAPRGLPESSTYEKMQILFSRRKTTADQLIAELIEAEQQPKQLRVVSSDHGVQRSARQRGVAYVDSEAWLREIWQSKVQEESPPADKVEPVQSTDDVQHWLRAFAPPPHTRQQPHTPAPPHTIQPKKQPRGKP